MSICCPTLEHLQGLTITVAQLALHSGPHDTVSACFPALLPLTHLGIQIVLDHMGRLACFLIKNLTTLFRSIRRSIDLAY